MTACEDAALDDADYRRRGCEEPASAPRACEEPEPAAKRHAAARPAPAGFVGRYQARAAFFRAYPRLEWLLKRANRLLVGAFYLAYVVLVAWALVVQPWSLIPLVAVPGCAFVLVSLFRQRFDRPRPYECTDIVPLIDREGSGKSFPSRHAFSAFLIASAWFAASTPIAVLLLVCASALAWCRVAGGVHFPRDVVAGALLGILAGGIAVACVLL